jgi:hypothetical protein
LVIGVLSYLALAGGRLLTVASCFCCLVNWVLYIMLFFPPETEVMRRFSQILIRAQAVSTILIHNCEVLTVAKWLLQRVTFTVVMDPNKHACMHWSLQTIGGFAAPFSKFEVWDQLKTASFW